MADRTTKVMNCGQNPKPRLLTIRAPREPRANQMEVRPTVTASPTPNRIRAASQNIGCICGSFLHSFALEGANLLCLQPSRSASELQSRPHVLFCWLHHYNTTRFVFFPQRFCKVFLRFRPFCTSARPPAHPHASARGRAFVFGPGQSFSGELRTAPFSSILRRNQKHTPAGCPRPAFQEVLPCLTS